MDFYLREEGVCLVAPVYHEMVMRGVVGWLLGMELGNRKNNQIQHDSAFCEGRCRINCFETIKSRITFTNNLMNDLGPNALPIRNAPLVSFRSCA